jgi:hypothetical protein
MPAQKALEKSQLRFGLQLQYVVAGKASTGSPCVRTAKALPRGGAVQTEVRIFELVGQALGSGDSVPGPLHTKSSPLCVSVIP